MRQFTEQFVVVVAPFFDAAEDVVVVQPAEPIQPLRIGLKIRSLNGLTEEGKERAAPVDPDTIRVKFPRSFEDHHQKELR